MAHEPSRGRLDAVETQKDGPGAERAGALHLPTGSPPSRRMLRPRARRSPNANPGDAASVFRYNRDG